MKKLSGLAVSKCSWSDVLLTGIKWKREGRDLVFSWVGSKQNIRTLTCTWACAITIKLFTSENEGGYPLTWNIEFKKLTSNGWKIMIDFNSNGIIELECSDIYCTFLKK